MRSKIQNPPIIAQWLLYHTLDKNDRDFVIGDFEEFYNEIRKKSGALSAAVWFWRQVLKSIPHFIKNSIYWDLIMFINYLKITFRNIMRNKGYSLINISGLALGITCCIFIFLYIQFETSYDSYHKEADRIYRIIASVNSSSGTSVYAGTAHQLMPYVKENFQQVEYIAKITPARADQQVKYGDKIFNETQFNIPYADEDIFKILSFTFIDGDPNTALSRPKTVVITQGTAIKYFGTKNPMGKVLLIGDENFEITGVINDLPGNTVFRFNMLRSWNSLDPRMFYPRWMNFHLTFVKLAPDEDSENFAQLVTKTVIDHSKKDFEKSNVEYSSILQPIKKIHLNSSNFIFERINVGNILYIYIFSGIGVIIILIHLLHLLKKIIHLV